MKVLFVSRGNASGNVSPIVHNQGESLKKAGLMLDYFMIRGSGPFAYIKAIYPLRKTIREGKYDVIHAHYSFTAFVATLASRKSIVVSLMGSDIMTSVMSRIMVRIFNSLFWKRCIVKSADMKKCLRVEKVFVIPNGVDMKKFIPADKVYCQNQINWDPGKKHILFAANPAVYEKNFPLAKKAIELLNERNVDFHWLENVSHEMMPAHYNASDVIFLSSISEGSPNAIKEALSCNRPIVSTDVGDVNELVDNVEGCFIASFDPLNMAEKLKAALNFSQSVQGRERLFEIGLDEESVAKRLIELYTMEN